MLRTADTQEHHLKATAEAVLATDPIEGETANVPRKKRLTPASEKRGLTSIMKALKNKKQKAQGLKSTEREPASPSRDSSDLIWRRSFDRQTAVHSCAAQPSPGPGGLAVR